MNNLLEEKFEEFYEDEFIATEQYNKRLYDAELELAHDALEELAKEIQKRDNVDFETALFKAKIRLTVGEDDKREKLIDLEEDE